MNNLARINKYVTTHGFPLTLDLFARNCKTNPLIKEISSRVGDYFLFEKIDQLKGLRDLLRFAELCNTDSSSVTFTSSEASTSQHRPSTSSEVSTAISESLPAEQLEALSFLCKILTWYAANYSDIARKFNELFVEYLNALRREVVGKTVKKAADKKVERVVVRNAAANLDAAKRAVVCKTVKKAVDKKYEFADGGNTSSHRAETDQPSLRDYCNQLRRGRQWQDVSGVKELQKNILSMKGILAANDSHLLVNESYHPSEIDEDAKGKIIIRLNVDHLTKAEVADGKIGGGHIFIKNQNGDCVLIGDETVKLLNPRIINHGEMSFCAGNLRSGGLSKYTSGFLLNNKNELCKVWDLVLQAATDCYPHRGRGVKAIGKLIGWTGSGRSDLQTFLWSKFIVHFIKEPETGKITLDTFFPLLVAGCFNIGNTDLPLISKGDLGECHVPSIDVKKIIMQSIPGLMQRIHGGKKKDKKGDNLFSRTLEFHGFTFDWFKNLNYQKYCLADSLVPLVDFDKKHIIWSFIDADTNFYVIQYFFEPKDSRTERCFRDLCDNDERASERLSELLDDKYDFPGRIASEERAELLEQIERELLRREQIVSQKLRQQHFVPEQRWLQQSTLEPTLINRTVSSVAKLTRSHIKQPK